MEENNTWMKFKLNSSINKLGLDFYEFLIFGTFWTYNTVTKNCSKTHFQNKLLIFFYDCFKAITQSIYPKFISDFLFFLLMRK